MTFRKLELDKSKIAPWLGFAAAVWVQVVAGITYSFPLYSNQMKIVLKYDQKHLNSIGVAVDIGQNVGLVAGFMSNRLPPWSILSIGSLSCFLGYGTLWLVMSGSISPLPFWLIWIAQLIGANSATWLGTAILVTNMRNFPLSRGTVSGILKGLSGLGGAVFTQIFTGFLDEDSVKLLLFLTIAPLIVCLVFMYFVRPFTPNTEDDTVEQKHLSLIQWLTILLALYLLLTSILYKSGSLDGHLISKLFAAIMLVLVAFPAVVPLKLAKEEITLSRKLYDIEHHETAKEPLLAVEVKDNEVLDVSSYPQGFDSNGLNDSSNGNTQSLASPSSSSADSEEMDNQILLAEGEGAIVRKKRKPRRGEDFNLKQAMVKADFWLLFFAFFCGVGSGVTVLNNLAQIGQASGYKNVTVLLSIIGVCNFLGRLGGGVISEHYIRQSLLPRTVWMVISQIFMVFTFLFFATALPGSLYICSFVLGICYGVQFAVMIPTASEIFGLKHFGIIYNFQTMGNPIGAYFFSALLAGYLYDKEAEKQASAGGGHLCLGSECFRLTFLLMAAVCAIGVIFSTILTIRIWPVYEKLYGNASFRVRRVGSDSTKGQP